MNSPSCPRLATKSLLLQLGAALALALFGASAAIAAAEPSIDRLIHKLPPPEKLAKPAVQQATAQRDPVLNDPLAKDAMTAFDRRNFSRALGSSRKFARKYPRNAVAHGLHGVIALSLRQLNEASVAFRTAVSVQPNFSFGYLGLGAAEAEQGRFETALNNFRQLTRLEPKEAIGWVAASGCAERLGRRQESLEYAKRATVVAPKSAAAWVALARAETTLGHWENAKRATARARELGATIAKPTRARR